MPAQYLADMADMSSYYGVGGASELHFTPEGPQAVTGVPNNRNNPLLNKSGSGNMRGESVQTSEGRSSTPLEAKASLSGSIARKLSSLGPPSPRLMRPPPIE